MDTLANTVVEEVNNGVNRIFYQIQKRVGIKNGDVAPEQELKIDAMKETMAETILETVKEQLCQQ